MLNPVTDAFEADLRKRLPSAAFKSETSAYFEEPRGRWAGHGLVIAPANTEEVALIVKACNAARVGIVPYGGGTGLVGGQLMEDGPKPVVLSLERMNKVRGTYQNENVIVVDAGMILSDVQAAATGINRLFPLSLASEGSARIGGLLSTNAGGVNVLRYGNARAQCLGLEVVRADGSIWNGLSRLRKDNTGYDLIDLFIGAEGSLGIITAAALQLAPIPASTGAAMMVVSGPEAALDLLSLAGEQMADGISAFELINQQGLRFLADVGPDVAQPFETIPEWSVLIDVGLPKGLEADDALVNLFETALEKGFVSDGVISQNETQRMAFWQIRESIPEANRRIGSIASHDISLPLSEIPSFVDEAPAKLAKIADVRINCFGHLGDGNLHYNVYPAEGRDKSEYTTQRDDLSGAIYDLVYAKSGSMSAEHGIGRLKVEQLEHYGSPEKLAMMQGIKDAFDPKGIMNPGAVLSPSGLHHE